MTTLTTNMPIRIVQITDTHLYGEASGTLLKMNTQDTLQHVIDLVQKEESDLDLILATGDIAQDASPEAYRNFIDAIAVFNTPYRWIAGNHDITRVMEDVSSNSDACEKEIRINNWLILMLDTSIEGQVHGHLCDQELEFLEARLGAASDDSSIEHCLICLHHNPIPGNAGWMKDIGLYNSEDFLKLVNRFTKTRAVVYGHIHQDLDFVQDDIRYLCTPSTCIQFKPEVTNFALDRVNPGYRSLKLFEDGTIDTEVKRVAGEVFEADYNSPGY